MKKALILTFYFPPSGKASLQLPLGIIRHLRSFDIEPVVVTVLDDSFSLKDSTFEDQLPENLKVIRTKVWEPFDLYRKFTGKRNDQPLVASETISKENKSLTHRISIWIRMNLFVPDARIGWYPYAVKACEELLNDSLFDYIISFGPPHSTHLIAKNIGRRFNIPYFPVFIDPWTDIAYYRGFKRSALTLSLDNYLEKSVLANCCHSFFVTDYLRNDYITKYPFLSNKSTTLFWGFDEKLFSIGADIKKNQQAEVLVHAGNIFDYQNPDKLWKTIRKLNAEGRNIRIAFIGSVSPLIKSAISEYGLDIHTDYLGFLPYPEMIAHISNADYLLVCPTEPRHIPGKLFEYLRTGNPIIAIGENNEEVKKIISISESSIFLTPEADPEPFFNAQKQPAKISEKVRMYERSEITRILSEILKESN